MTALESSLLDHLLEASHAGDAQAKDQAFALISQIVIGWIGGHVFNHADADDIRQEILVTLVQEWDHLPAGQLPGWLVRTTRNKIGDHIRRAKRQQRLLEPHSDGLLSIPDQISLQPDVGYEFKAFASLVDQLWLTLSPDEQQLFSLLFERVSEVEIRQRLGGVSSGALRARIYRLRSKLRRECAKAGYARCSIPGSPG